MLSTREIAYMLALKLHRRATPLLQALREAAPLRRT